MRRALTGPLSFGLSKAIASPEGVGGSPVLPSNRLVSALMDSRGAQAVGIASPSAKVFINHGFHIFWAQGLALARCRTIYEHNICTAGWTSEDALANVASVIATGAGTCILLVSINDRAAGWTAQRSKDAIAAIIAALRAADIVVILCNETPKGDTTYTAARLTGDDLTNHLDVRDWCTAQHSPTNGIYVADTFGSIAVPSSPTGDAVVGTTRDGTHQTILGAYLMAKPVQAVYEQLWDYDPTVLPANDSDPRLLSSNPFMTGTGGSVLTGGTGGVMATGKTFNRASAAAGMVWTMAKNAGPVLGRTDVQKYTMGGTPAATGAVDISRQQSLHSGLGASEYAGHVLEVVLGTDMVNLRGLMSGFRMIGAADNWHVSGWMASVTDTMPLLSEPEHMIILSPRIQNPGSLTNLWNRPGAYSLGAAVGSGAFDILTDATMKYAEA